MAIPADDPRLAPVIIERDLVEVEPFERDDVGRLIFSEDVNPETFVSLQPIQRQYNKSEAKGVLDTRIRALATETEPPQETQTTVINAR
jgi:hypothetical protein